MARVWRLLFLPWLQVVAWRHAERATSVLQSSSELIRSVFGSSEVEVISSTALKKVLCTRRLPYFRNRLCLELKGHTAAIEEALKGRPEGQPMSTSEDQTALKRALENPVLAIPDLTIDLGWMGCSTCVEEMRTCSQGQLCREDPKDGLSYPWIHIFPLSLQSLIAGRCYGVADMLVTSTAAAAFAPFLGVLAPYLSGLLGSFTSRAIDELLLGRYCIFLTTHLAHEEVGGQKLAQDSTCIDHMYTIHIPGMFGIVKARKFYNPQTSLVCWPTAGQRVLGGPFLPPTPTESASGDHEEGEGEGDDLLAPPAIASPARILQDDKVCREGSSPNLCAACEVAIQAATWRLLELKEKIEAAGSLQQLVSETGDGVQDEELEVVENKMIVHANDDLQCESDSDRGCRNDYSLCVLKAGYEDAEECVAETVHPLGNWTSCWWLCKEGCHTWTLGEPYCEVEEEHLGQTCSVRKRYDGRFSEIKVERTWFGGAGVYCNYGPNPFYPKLWQHRMVKLYAKLRNTPNTTMETREAASRQVLQRLAEPAPSAPELSLLDVSLLRVAQLAANYSFHEIRGIFCQEAACCGGGSEGIGNTIRSS